jgi:REP element-mobilizing transposase RayT
MPRGARLDTPGTLHYVIVRGIERRNIVDDDPDREDFVTRLGRLAEDSRTAVYAWALLDNHAHVLMRSGPSGISAFMRRLLTGYAVSYNRRHHRYGHLFTEPSTVACNGYLTLHRRRYNLWYNKGGEACVLR